MKDLFNKCKELMRAMSDELCMNTMVTIPNEYLSPTYRNCKETREVFFINGNRGTICNDNVIEFETLYFKKNDGCNMKMFTFYQGDVVQLMKDTKDKDCIIWIEAFDCLDGSYNWYKEIRSVEDLKDMLLNIYYIEEEDWEELFDILNA